MSDLFPRMTVDRPGHPFADVLGLLDVEIGTDAGRVVAMLHGDRFWLTREEQHRAEQLWSAREVWVSRVAARVEARNAAGK